MKRKFIMAAALVAIAATSAALAAPRARRALDPRPGDSSGLLSQLKRFKGQTSFVNLSYNYRFDGPMPSPAKEGQPDGGARRAIQESDVFKVGNPGSKLLYLLNDYRGLQVISYADGIFAPKIIGRAAPSGYSPETMYSDLENDRLIVLENDWGGGNQSESARLVAYDVKDPTDPKVSAEFRFEGAIADSRIVGRVLYVATTVSPRYGYPGRDQAKGQGFVYSLKLGKQGISEIEKQTLALPVSRRENMNIVEVGEGKATRYYLLAVLSESGWGWWDRSNLVEVVDISDPNGKIQPVMAVSSRGAIAERSQTFIRNNTLVVVSNYRPDTNGSSDNRSPQRIAVEAFKLPTSSDETITDFEATFRKLNIERELQGLYGDERERRHRELIADPKLGLQGRFISTAGGSLRKLVADHSVTVGDGSGLHASLRDARVDGNLLYVFWVPQNEVDPFDLFDISAPEKEIRHLKRLQFDGWIERAIPLAFQGHRYVLGLGWIVDTVNNETRRRSPQARLFEIIQRGDGSYRNIEVADFQLSAEQGWVSFEGRDHNIEVQLDADGKGSVLFPVQRFYKESGGKVISFDLRAAHENREAGVFRDGAFLAGDASWLKRVFTNPEIARINSFSNETLGTFDVTSLHGSDGIVRAVHLLELARSIEGYEALSVGRDRTIGVQLISGRAADGVVTTLRSVLPSRADAERPEALGELTLPGRIVAHKTGGRGLYVVLESCANRCQYVMHEIRVAESGAMQNVGTAELSSPAAADAMPRSHGIRSMPPMYWRRYFSLNSLPSGELVAINGGAIHWITVRDRIIKAIPIQLESCGELPGMELRFLGGATYFHVEEPVTSEIDVSIPNYLSLTRNWLIPVQIEGAKAICGSRINIPGSPVAQMADGTLVTREDRVLDLKDYPITAQSLSSLVISTQAPQAMLMDDYDLGRDFYGELATLRPGELSFFKTRDAAEQLWITLGVDSDHSFTQSVVALGEEWIKGAQIRWVSPNGDLALLSNGRDFQVAQWSGNDTRPTVRKISQLDTQFRPMPAQGSIRVAGWHTSADVVFSDGQFVVPNGLFGLVQFY